MKHHVLASALFLLMTRVATAGTQTAPHTTCAALDERYVTGIERAIELSDKKDAVVTRAILDASMRVVMRNKDYQVARTLVLGVGSEEPIESVRMEIGNANDESYDVVWILKTASDHWMVTNYSGSLRRVSLSENAWERLKDDLDAVSVGSLGPAVDLGVDDASSYFVSVCKAGIEKQVIIHGPVSYTHL